MIDRVLRTIGRYSMFERGQRVGVAVSGGADSVALLHVLFELAPRWGLRLSVLHLDHRLRGEESREDARFVQQLAHELGLEAHLADSDVRQISQDTGDNLEQAARQARREFFLGFLRSGTLDRVALGHTRSDQAETVLFRFLRGAGSAGLAGIRPVTEEGLVRPLIEVDRTEVQQYLRERSIPWRDDSTNDSPEYARNRIRHCLLPALAKDWNPALAETLAHTADWALEEERYWEQQIDQLSAAHFTLKTPAILLRARELCDLPRAVARRLVRRAIERAKGDLRGVDFQHVEQALALAAAPEGHGRLQIPGVDVFRSFDWIRFAPPGLQSLENRNLRLPLQTPGRTILPDHSSVVELRLTTADRESSYTEGVSCLDWDRLPGSLELRYWRPGDQYQPRGYQAQEKIKSLFQQARIPLWERRNWPIITTGDSIVWARQFGPAAEFAVTEATRSVLTIRETAVAD